MQNSEYFRITSKLLGYHSCFYQAWSLGEPLFTEAIPTAAVGFDKYGERVLYMFNPKFWKELNDTERCFVICHECFHVLLKHGKRALGLDKAKGNIALDIPINHNLFDNMYFDKTEFSRLSLKDICLVENVFDKPVSKEKCAEHYYKLLMEGDGVNPKFNRQIIDVHLTKEDIEKLKEVGIDIQIVPSQNLEDKLEEISVDGAVEGEEKEKGEESGTGRFKAKYEYNPKRKWETIIKNWALKQGGRKLVEQWARKGNRHYNLRHELLLPFEIEEDSLSKEKIDVWFYQDTSGSCQHLAQRFFNAANSLPKNRFRVKLFGFDTSVYEIVDNSLKGFGGTAFDIIENHIQENAEKYPTVFVITDGYGNNVQPEFPKKWHWFLSADYKHCIPDECNTYNLEDYE